MTPYNYDLVVIGGGLGGCAAALAACRRGLRAALTDPTDWLGGQMTSQGVSALDEHRYIESFGGTASYIALRNAIREHYYTTRHVPRTLAPLNPGNGWVSGLCFEPRVGLAALTALLRPYVENSQLTVLLNTVPVGAALDGHRILEISVEKSNHLSPPVRPSPSNREGSGVGITLSSSLATHPSPLTTTLRAPYFIDASELGDLLPLTNTAYITGAESRHDTGEVLAPDEARPTEIQSFTYCFAVEYRPNERHVVVKPDGYETFRDSQPYSLILEDKDGNPRPFQMFGGELPFWTYRRLLDGSLLGGNDLALINWHSNDYFGRHIIDVSPEDRTTALDEAKRLALGFLYWLQTECPRDEGGYGYPEIMLRPDVMGTEDGLSKHPYIRESRRILPLKRIVAHDLLAENQDGEYATAYPDAIGIGWYYMDLHPCVGNPKAGMFAPTKPFQIPLGACIPRETVNLLAACKNIGTTHLSNGSYRLHPVEWNIGESLGELVAYCLEHHTTPHEVYHTTGQLTAYQQRLRQNGIPLSWEERT